MSYVTKNHSFQFFLALKRLGKISPLREMQYVQNLESQTGNKYSDIKKSMGGSAPTESAPLKRCHFISLTRKASTLQLASLGVATRNWIAQKPN